MIFILSLALLLSAFSTMTESNEIAKSNEKFGAGLYKFLTQQLTGKNVVFSPLSAHAVLTLAYQGAGGKTTDSFANVLNLMSPKYAARQYQQILSSLNYVPNVTLDIANKVYVKSGYKLKSSFQDVARNFFLSDVEQVDFEQSRAAADTINFWVQWKTKNKIKNLVNEDSFDRDTRLVLVNAVYFLGKWASPFDKQATVKKPFYSNYQLIYVDTMHADKLFNYAYDPRLDAKILELPYANSDLSLLVILPNQRDGLPQLEEKLAYVSISESAKYLEQTQVDVSLPKFKIETSVDLTQSLSQLGLGIIFSDDADFSKFLEVQKPLKISNVVQKAFIEVGEEGTEAAAATGMVLYHVTSLKLYPKASFTADHPFVFVLNSKKFGTLFSGRVLKPE